MASVLLSPIGNGVTFFNNNGAVLNGGLIYTYQAGSSTPLATYTTNSGNIANTNPIVLGTNGISPQEIWLQTGYSYKFIIQDSLGNTIQTLDNIYPILQSASASVTIPSGLISIWSGSTGSIPSGWVICDGSNGTPDLRSNFVIGAGSTYSVGATGTIFSVGTSAPNYYALAFIQKT
jgi:predicted outer membrane repeat protein